ncbi:hypothetical protein [Streptomyces neyagawaensis]|uniref:Uncharacterized protein n=1 Tax=Streptomyces neyagawaensis TaxID=42238 RepID=A0ABV3B0N7_9ACTN
MNAVVHRGARTHETEIRVAEAPAQAKERGGRGVGSIARRDGAIPGRSPAGRWSRANDVTEATGSPASPASDRVGGIVPPVDGGRPGR